MADKWIFMLTKLWDYIVNHNVWSKVAAGVITAAIVALLAYLYSLIKDVNFIALLKSLFSFQLPFGYYLIITIGAFVVFRFITRVRKKDRLNRDEKEIVATLNNASELLSTPVTPAVNPDLIFDSNIADVDSFNGYGKQVFDSSIRKLVGVHGAGTWEFKEKILTISRTNKEGRFIIPITHYYFKGKETDFVPKNIYGKNPRCFQVIFFSRAISGNHKLLTVFREIENFDWLNNNELIVTHNDWERHVVSYSLPSDKELLIEFHTYLDSSSPATLQIKEIYITEK